MLIKEAGKLASINNHLASIIWCLLVLKMVESKADNSKVTLSDLKADSDQIKSLLGLVLERLDAI